jgi:hypothetical protein
VGKVLESRNSTPSVANVDSQTVHTAVMVSEVIQYDAGKKRMRVSASGDGFAHQAN